MKKLIFILTLLLVGNVVHSQTIPGVNASQHKEYVMKTYKVDDQKADEYEQLLASLQKENNQLKNRKISSEQFKAEQKKLYKKYGTKINQAFYDGKYRTWSYCTQELERYQVLSDNLLIPYDKVRELYKAEAEWDKEREKNRKGAGEESKKHEKNDAMLTELNRKIVQILGNEAGNWYVNYRIQLFTALSNMDKYGISYKDALSITQIEETYKKKRDNIWNNRKKNAEREMEIMASNEEMAKKIASTVPTAASKWKKVNQTAMNHELNAKFGLSQAQANKFKTAYNKYSIEEYKILNQKQVSNTEKYTRLSSLNEEFCKDVQPLFQAANYTKWHGWWKYSFERKMKRKGIK